MILLGLLLHLFIGGLIWLIGVPYSRARVVVLWLPALCLPWRLRVRLV